MHAFFQRFTHSPTRLLIVEPNLADAKAILARMKSLYRVEMAASGQQALERLASFKPDVVITEADLPDLSGVELIQTARSLPQQQHIVWIIASHRQAITDKVASLQAGAADHLVKPLDLQALPALLRNAYRLHDIAQKFIVS